MSKIICSICREVHNHVSDGKCPQHPESKKSSYNFQNSDGYLDKETEKVTRERLTMGLDGLVGGLEAVIINTQKDKQKAAVQEFLATTGYNYINTYSDEAYITSILKLENSADILVRVRKEADNPFRKYNLNPKSAYLPDTRLETFVFGTTDIHKYHTIQKNRGIRFLSDEVIEYENYYFIQSLPSEYTGISIGLIQWKNESGNYAGANDQKINWNFAKPQKEYLKNIGYLDHTATRVRAKDRDPAIIEFMELTNYHFDFALYVKNLNSITNVARLSSKDFAMVFTSGIVPFKSLDDSGPTEKYIYNYGTRTHHLAFVTQHIEEVYEKLKEDGVDYLVDLIGSPEDGLKQTFTVASPNTLIVNEYLHRFGDFTGFFSQKNVTLLTKSTEKQ